MRLLVLSDKESNYLWDSENPKRLEDIDLILSCGDLRPEYLSFIATFTHAPVLYVHGNHDDRYQETPPDGCFCIENSCQAKILQIKSHKDVSSHFAKRRKSDNLFRYCFCLAISLFHCDRR